MRVTLLMAVLGLLLAAWVPAGAKNLMLNGNFADIGAGDMPENWGVRAWTVDPMASVSTQPGRNRGDRALAVKVDAGKTVYGAFSRAIDVSGLEVDRLMLSARYRTEGTPKVQSMVVSFDTDFMQAEWETRPLYSEARVMTPARKWQDHTWFAELVPSTRQVVVVFQVLSAGTLFLDEVVLRPYPGQIRADDVEVGRVADLAGTRRTTLRLTSTSPGATRTQLTLTPLQDRNPVGRPVRTDLTLERDQPQDVDLRYRFSPEEAHQVELLLTEASTDEVLWFHRAEVPGLIDAHMRTPAFRGTITSTHAVPELVVDGRIFSVPGIREQVSLQARLLGTGAEATEGRGIRRGEEGEFRITLPAEGLLIGDHKLRIEALMDRRRVVATTSLPVRRTRPVRSEVTYDADHRLWVEGKPVFPLGIYYAMDVDDLDVIKEAGFNMAVVPSARASYLMADSAAAKGIGLVVASPATQRDFWRMRQDKFGDHPALMGWEVLQRPDAKLIHPDIMLALYQIISEVSPTHPVATTLVHAETMSDYARATDIIIPWELPVPQMPVTRIADVVNNARAATEGRKPVWALIQATGNAWATDNTMDDTAEGRLPTVAEVRAMAYLALVHGADGLLFYSYHLIQSGKQRHYRITRDAPDLWAGISSLNRELGALASVVGDRAGRTLLPPAGDGLIHMTHWTHGDQSFIIAVNTTDRPTVASLTLPGLPATVLELPFEDRMLESTSPGEFLDAFEPYGVHVYTTKSP